MSYAICFSIFSYLIAGSAFAAANFLPNNQGLPSFTEGNESEGARTVIQNALGWFFLIAGLLCIIIIIWAGISYATAGGDEEKVGKAKTRLIYGIIGVAVIIGSYIITQIIQSAITGNLTPNI